MKRAGNNNNNGKFKRQKGKYRSNQEKTEITKMGLQKKKKHKGREHEEQI